MVPKIDFFHQHSQPASRCQKISISHSSACNNIFLSSAMFNILVCFQWWIRYKMESLLLALVATLAMASCGGMANPEAKRLYDDLLSNYNRLIRPVGNNSDRLTVKMGLRLSQLIDVVSTGKISTITANVLRWTQRNAKAADT